MFSNRQRSGIQVITYIEGTQTVGKRVVGENMK